MLVLYIHLLQFNLIVVLQLQ